MKKLVAFVLALVMMVTLIACNGDTSTSPTGSSSPAAGGNQPDSADTPTGDRYGGTLRYAIPYSPGSPLGLPWKISGPTSYSSELCIEPLLKELSDTTIVPNLAEAYDVDTTPGSASITFYLRTDVKFHDGTQFNAEAVKWNLEKQQEKGGKNTSIAKAWKAIDVVDEFTVKVTVENWENDMMYGFADVSAFMVSPTAYETHGEEWMEYNMIGTGPFLQEKYESEVSLTVKRNPDYWQEGKPYVDEIILLYVTDDVTRETLIKTGGCDILSNGRDCAAANELAEEGYIIENKPGNGNFALWPDSANADSPWSDIRVRMAAEYALDKELFAESFGYGYLEPLYQFTAPSQIGNATDITERKYDVEKAKQLLADAGYPNGFESTIIVSTNVTDRDSVIAIQAYLSEVGINCNIEYPTSSAYNEIYAGGTWNNALIYTPINFRANPNISFKQYLSSDSSYFMSLARPEGYDELIDAALASADPEAETIAELNRVLVENCTIIPVTDSCFPWILTDKVHDAGLGIYSTGSFWNPEDVWMSK